MVFSMELDTKIEAILFWKGESLSIAEIARMLKVPSGEVKRGLSVLQDKLAARGLSLARTDNEVAMVTSPSVSELLKQLQKEEMSGDFGKAALETLSIILYRAPISRRDIEYIRGVNSTTILRSLLIRGLVERAPSAEDERVFTYVPTISLLSLLGARSVEELPEYESVREEMKSVQPEQSVSANNEGDKSEVATTLAQQ